MQGRRRRRGARAGGGRRRRASASRSRSPPTSRPRRVSSAYIAAAVDRFGRIDLYHLNAGIGGTLAPYPDIEIDEFDAVMNVNVRGAFLGLRAAFRQFEQQEGGGAIVLTASIASDRGSSDLVPYTVSKAAVASLARTAAVHGGPRGVRVNAVAPGIVPTNLLVAPTGADQGGSGDAVQRARNSPVGRAGYRRRGRGAGRVPAQRRCVVRGRRHHAGRRRRSSHEPGPPQRRRQPIANPRGRPVHTFPRPTRPVPLRRAHARRGRTCPECGAADLAEYRVLARAAGGTSASARRCLASVRGSPARCSAPTSHSASDRSGER